MATHQSIQKGQIPVRPKGSEKCASHRKNDVIFACTDCQVLICATCSIGLHKPHELVEISNLTNQNKTSLQDFINENEGNKLPQLQKDIQAARQLVTPNSTKFKGLAKIIKSQMEKCKEEMEILGAEFLSLCDKMESDNEELIQGHITELEEKYDLLTEKTKECKETLQSGDNIEMYDVVAEVNILDTTRLCMPLLASAQFNPSQDLSNKLKKAIGTLDIFTDQKEATLSSTSGQAGKSGQASKSGQTRKSDHASGSGQASRSDHASGSGQASKQRISKPTIMSKKDFTFYDRPVVVSKSFFDYAVTSICPTPDGGHAWVSYQYSNPPIAVELRDKKGHVIRKLNHRNQITDISVSPTTGSLWFCCDSDKTINEVLPSDQSIVTKFRVADKPETLCIGREGHVMVGTESRKNNLTIYTATGRVLHTAVSEYGTTEPLHIVECPVTGNIAIIRGKETGRNNTQYYIVVFDKLLNLKFSYKGEGRKAVEPFQPSSIAYDNKGNILFVDYSECTIELINGNGQYIRKLHTADEQGQIGIQMTDNVVWAEMLKDGRDIKLLKFYY